MDGPAPAAPTKSVTNAWAHGPSGTRQPFTSSPSGDHGACTQPLQTPLRMPALLPRVTAWFPPRLNHTLVSGHLVCLPLRIGRRCGPGTALILFACAVQPKASKAFSDGFTSCASSRDGRRGITGWYWGASVVNSPVSTGLTRTLAFVAVAFGDCLTSRFYDGFQRLPARHRKQLVHGGQIVLCGGAAKKRQFVLSRSRQPRVSQRSPGERGPLP